MKPKIYIASDHDIDFSLVDSDAVHVIKKLQDAGFTAYLVGGSVRDLLIKKVPKDYDISTSARPEQVKQIFQRSCLLIGRRFRLAHVRFGHKIIEVSTFRRGENDSDLIVQDNEWGTPEEDVLRRDFTINGLFYNPTTHEIIDYVGGWEDIHKKLIRTIGNPVARFKQDPVRMIRLLKFIARIGFEVDQESLNALSKYSEEIVKSSPARILEEFFRMLESGYSEPFIKLLGEYGLLDHLFPCLHHFLFGNHGQEVYNYLSKVDQLSREDNKHTLDRSILTAALLYPILQQEIHSQYLSKNYIPHIGEILALTSSIIKGVIISSFSHFPRRISSTVGYILSLQYRMTPLAGKKHIRPKLFHHKEFILALNFFKIRAMVNPELQDDYNNWKNLHKQIEKQSERRGRHHHPSPEQAHHSEQPKPST